MNVLHILVDNSAELLATAGYGSGALILLESSSDNVTFAAVGSGTALVSGTATYTVYHSAGTTTTWYRTRYANSGSTVFSEYSPAFQVEQGPENYASLGSVKLRLGKTTTTADDIIESICGQVNVYIESLTQRPIGPDATTVYTVDGYDAFEDGRCLLFPRGIRSITTLEVATTTGGTFATVASADYFLRPTAANRQPGWPATEVWMTDIPTSSNPYFYPGYANVRITGTFGWAAIPADLREVAEVLAVRAYNWRMSGSTDTSGGSDVGEWLAGRDAMPKRDQLTISRYIARQVFVI